MQVKVHVLKARNLTAADSDGTSDPYAVVLVGDDEAEFADQTVSSTLAPEWGELQLCRRCGRQRDRACV